MTAKKIEVMKTTAEGIFFLITRTQDSSKQEIKSRRKNGNNSK